jgi:hypothetical protein
MKKIITSIITAALLFELAGCYSRYTVDPNDYVESDVFMNQRIAGAKVFIDLNNGMEYTGELLSVRDSIMLLCEQYGASEEDLSNSVFEIKIFKNHNIEFMEVQGESKILSGVAIGSAAGAVVGIAIGAADGDDPEGFISFTAEEKACLTGCLGGGVGAVIGLIAGAFNSTDDAKVYNYEIKENYDFTQLNIFSRYQGNEPVYLKEIR